jgi:hypothetical protein
MFPPSIENQPPHHFLDGSQPAPFEAQSSELAGYDSFCRLGAIATGEHARAEQSAQLFAPPANKKGTFLNH